jgi:hypothetical protein
MVERVERRRRRCRRARESDPKPRLKITLGYYIFKLLLLAAKNSRVLCAAVTGVGSACWTHTTTTIVENLLLALGYDEDIRAYVQIKSTTTAVASRSAANNAEQEQCF